jgi:hypothetical protein
LKAYRAVLAYAKNPYVGRKSSAAFLREMGLAAAKMNAAFGK